MQNKANFKTEIRSLPAISVAGQTTVHRVPYGKDRSLPAISVAGQKAEARPPSVWRDRRQKADDRRQKLVRHQCGGSDDRRQKLVRHQCGGTEDGYCWKILSAATIFNLIKKLTTNWTGANLKAKELFGSLDVPGLGLGG